MYTASVYSSASFQAPCSAWSMGVIIPILQMEILERLGQILNYIHPTHLGLSSPVHLLTCEGDGPHMGAPSISSFLQIPEVLGLSSTHCPSWRL